MPVSQVTRLKKAVDELLRRVIGWLQDPHGGSIVPEPVRVALHRAEAACDEASVPELCRPLATTAVNRLAEELRGYDNREHGKIRLENDAPGPSFWAAVAQVARTRSAADEPIVERLEPVSVLLAQGVSHSQIGRHIYGRRGLGPFIQSNGDVDVALIEQEGRSPGSVIEPDWVPPWVREAMTRRQQDLDAQLKLFEKMEVARKYDDPATVEQLLQEGAFVQQIELAKGVTRSQVLQTAKRIGVEAIDGPSYHPETDTPALIDDDGSDAVEAVDDPDVLRQAVIERFTAANGNIGSAEIAAELRKQGYHVGSHSVSAIIGHWRKRRQSEPATTV